VLRQTAAATGTERVPRATTGKGRPLPPWNVLLHNDDVNEARFVVRTVMRVVHLNFPAATDVMITAHTRGRALVVTTHKERAELFRDQFATRGLTATIEPAQT
jgi:ATP-dependent Clp protease adaptor protein ClpS